MLGSNCISAAGKVAIKNAHPKTFDLRKVPELALFLFQSSGPSSLLACSSFFPFPSQYMISSELRWGGRKSTFTCLDQPAYSSPALLSHGPFPGLGLA